jgi:hypothetical protein
MDLHPEDLLDRDAAGELGQAERERLDLHLLHCPACRLERRVRDDFRRVADPADLDVRALISNALLPPQIRRRRVPVAARMTRLRFGLVAAALLAFTGLAAAAAGSLGAVWHRAVDPVEPRPSGTQPTAAAPRATAWIADVTMSSPARIDSSSSVVAAPPIAPPRVLAPSSDVSALVDSPESASRLFAAGNRARRQGDHLGAAAAYRHLVARHPASVEAHESLVVLGRMLLDDGDASGALESFDSYATRGGALAAEAMLGKALALRALGRVDEERSAWSALLETYADSVYADRARRRLAELGP